MARQSVMPRTVLGTDSLPAGGTGAVAMIQIPVDLPVETGGQAHWRTVLGPKEPTRSWLSFW